MAENIVTNKIVLPEPEPNIIIHVGRSKSSKSISLKIKPNDKNEKNIEIILSFLTRFIAVRIDKIKEKKYNNRPLHYKRQWRWCCGYRNALKFAKELVPHSKIKKQDLQNIIDHYEKPKLVES